MEKKYFYNDEETVENAVCCNCEETHFWDEYDCEVYRGKFVCADCYQKYFGNCNECGELNKYEDMSEDIVCRECEKNGILKSTK